MTKAVNAAQIIYMAVRRDYLSDHTEAEWLDYQNKLIVSEGYVLAPPPPKRIRKYLKVRGKDAYRINPEWPSDGDRLAALNKNGTVDLEKTKIIRALAELER